MTSEERIIAALADAGVRPYYADKWRALIHGDCMDTLSLLPNNGVDLVLTDPPYGKGIGKTGSMSIKGASKIRREYTPTDWDVLPDPACFAEMRRVSVHQVVWGGNYFTDHLPPTKGWLVWYKKDGLPAKTFADCELAWTSLDTPARVFNSRWHGFIRDSREARLPVPTQKALDLFVWCLERAKVEPGQVVLDPFVGSGTTLVAGARVGVYSVGIERNAEYCEIAAQRCRDDLAARAS
jgi:DNA modification methylase